MAVPERIPDLNVLAFELAKSARAQWPGLVTREEVQRLEDAKDGFLVGLRVLCILAIKAGMPEDEVARIAKKASDIAGVAIPSGPASIDPDPAHIHRVPRFDELLAEIDAATLSPAERARFPGWFIDDYWPGLLRRLAQGERGTSRDQSILVRVLETCSGRRW